MNDRHRTKSRYRLYGKHRIGDYYNSICPMCKSDKYHRDIYTDDCWGAFMVVEEHSLCNKCGYMVEMAYSDPIVGFSDIRKGFRGYKDKYYSKNIKKHKKIRNKLKIKGTSWNFVCSNIL